MTMLMGTILCWGAWGIVITNIDPFETSSVGHAFFYLSLTFALIGTLTIVSYAAVYFQNRGSALPLYRLVQKSFVYGLTSTFLLVALLYLQQEQYLHYWNFGILIVIVIFLLFLRLSTRRKGKSQVNETI